MARFQNATTGIVVSVADEKADRFAPDAWTRLDDAPATAEATGYQAQKVDDLKAEIARRNAERPEDDQLSADGKKADLVATLEADDAATSGE